MKRVILILIIALPLVGIDQWTKQWALTVLGRQPVEVFPGFQFQLIFNPGVAFGMLGDSGVLIQSILPFFIGLLTIALWVFCWRSWMVNRLFAIATLLIASGAVGNLIDRIRIGAVVDFIDLYIGNWHWPAFNIADMLISVGVMLLLLDIFRTGKTATADDSS